MLLQLLPLLLPLIPASWCLFKLIVMTEWGGKGFNLIWVWLNS